MIEVRSIGETVAVEEITAEMTLKHSDDSMNGSAARERLRRTLTQHPLEGISREEVDAHFASMPDRYWSRVKENELAWGLQTVHRFLNQLISTSDGRAPVVMDYRHSPQQGCTKIIVCTWDHLGLLTQIAGYLSALRLNVIKAEVYTRSDNIVLDVFWVTDANGGQVAQADRLLHLNFLLEGGLSDPPRFASAWAQEAHKHQPRNSSITPTIQIDNNASTDHTIIQIEATERLGLLHDILEVFSRLGLNVSEALIDTVGEIAWDTFLVTNSQQSKINDPELEADLRARLAQAAV